MNDYSFFLLLQGLNLLWLVGVSVIVWLRRPGVEANAAVARMRDEFGKTLEQQRVHLDERMRAQDLELADIKVGMKHMPSSEELARMGGLVQQTDARMQGVNEQLGSVMRQLQMIQEFLLNNRK